jgi:hypothetical protein
MKRHIIYLTIIACLLATLVSCNRVDESVSDFDNVAYLGNAVTQNSETVALKNTDTEITKVIFSSLALPADADVQVTYKVDFSLVEHYNAAYYTQCEPLSEEFFELSDKQAIIPAGGVRSTDVTLRFKNLQNIPRGTQLLLPVSMESTNGMNILNGSKTMYYLIKKGAPVVVAANIKETFLELRDPASATSLKNLNAVTMEALIRPHEWGTEAGISSVMGIEGYFLIRIGDSGFPTEQIQIAKSSVFGGNWPSADNNKRLKKDVWQHIALTFDLVTREMVLYVDGKVQSRGTQGGTTGTLTLSPTYPEYFYIGRAWSDNRPLRGEICEARIWNIIRTSEEIASHKYEVDPATPGLVAYWKFDEGVGNDINDYTGNGNHLMNKPGTSITWVPVEVGLEE